MNLELDFRPLRTRAFKPGSQSFRILEWLRSGKTITPFEALQRFGTLALHSRIAELREAGWDVKCKLVDGHGEYSL
jgi:hypothetical protein